MRHTAFCGDVSMGGVKLRLSKSPRHGAASAERTLRLPGDGPSPERTPGGRPVRRE
jgi:hypothetical protein